LFKKSPQNVIRGIGGGQGRCPRGEVKKNILPMSVDQSAKLSRNKIKACLRVKSFIRTSHKANQPTLRKLRKRKGD